MSPEPLRRAALIALIVGTAGSLAVMLVVGRSAPRFLLVLFAAWVASPFVALLAADRLAGAWSHRTRTALYAAALAVTLGSLAAYVIVAFGPPRSKTFIFVIVPPLAWLLSAIVVASAAIAARTRSRHRPDR